MGDRPPFQQSASKSKSEHRNPKQTRRKNQGRWRKSQTPNPIKPRFGILHIFGHLKLWLFWVFCEKAFTTEARSSQRLENFFNQGLSTPRPPRLRGGISESVSSQESLTTQNCFEFSLSGASTFALHESLSSLAT